MTTLDTRERMAMKLIELDDGGNPEAVMACKDEAHSGDCTKQAWTCARCQCDDYLGRADAILAAFPALAPTAGDVETARNILIRYAVDLKITSDVAGALGASIATALTARAAQAEAPLRKALERISGWRPVTQEHELATSMADEADAALREPRHES